MIESALQPTVSDLLTRIKNYMGDLLLHADSMDSCIRLEVKPEDIYFVAVKLKEHPAFLFRYFIDITAVDYSLYPEVKPGRFLLLCVLLSPHFGVRLQIGTYLNGNKPNVTSLTSVFSGACWAEREVYDLFGIYFDGHPDLKRILLPDTFNDHPLRKEYPMEGMGERAEFETYEVFRRRRLS